MVVRRINIKFMSKTPINNLTKEQFLKEFNEGMLKQPEPDRVDMFSFLHVLLMKGILNPDKYFEFVGK
jgi:hypothetical protein